MKNIFLLLAMFGCNPSFAADNLIGDGKSGVWQLVDSHGNRWNTQLSMTTNGSGDIFTLGDVASADNIIGSNPSGQRMLIDNSGKRWNANVTYTTDGSGNVIPVAPPVAGVSSLNTLTGAVVLAAGANVTLTPVGNTITIASSGGGGGGTAIGGAVTGGTSGSVLFVDGSGNLAQDNSNFFRDSTQFKSSSVVTGTTGTNQPNYFAVTYNIASGSPVNDDFVIDQLTGTGTGSGNHNIFTLKKNGTQFISIDNAGLLEGASGVTKWDILNNFFVDGSSVKDLDNKNRQLVGTNGSDVVVSWGLGGSGNEARFPQQTASAIPYFDSNKAIKSLQNSSGTKQFLSQTSSGTPVLGALAAGDLPAGSSNYVSTLGGSIIQSSAIGTVGLVLKQFSAGGISAHLQEWRDHLGNLGGYVDNLGSTLLMSQVSASTLAGIDNFHRIDIDGYSLVRFSGGYKNVLNWNSGVFDAADGSTAIATLFDTDGLGNPVFSALNFQTDKIWARTGFVEFNAIDGVINNPNTGTPNYDLVGNILFNNTAGVGSIDLNGGLIYNTASNIIAAFNNFATSGASLFTASQIAIDQIYSNDTTNLLISFNYDSQPDADGDVGALLVDDPTDATNWMLRWGSPDGIGIRHVRIYGSDNLEGNGIATEVIHSLFTSNNDTISGTLIASADNLGGEFRGTMAVNINSAAASGTIDCEFLYTRNGNGKVQQAIAPVNAGAFTDYSGVVASFVTDASTDLNYQCKFTGVNTGFDYDAIIALERLNN